MASRNSPVGTLTEGHLVAGICIGSAIGLMSCILFLSLLSRYTQRRWGQPDSGLRTRVLGLIIGALVCFPLLFCIATRVPGIEKRIDHNDALAMGLAVLLGLLLWGGCFTFARLLLRWVGLDGKYSA